MKPSIHKLLVPIIYLIGTFFINAQTQEQSCEELLEYRNKTLVKIYNNKYNKYKIRKELINDIKNIREKLIDDIGLRTSNIVYFPMVTKLLSNIIEDSYAIAAPGGDVVNTMKNLGLKNIERYENVSVGIDLASPLVEESIEKNLALYSLKFFGRTGAVIKLVTNLQENVNNFNEFTILKKDVTDQLNNIEKALVEYNKGLELSSSNYNEIRGHLNSVDEYLKKYCKKEVARNPIDVESMLWDTNDENSSADPNSSPFTADMIAQLNDPEFLKNFDFEDTNFVNEIMDLYKKIDYNSEASVAKFNEDVNRVLKKYMKKSGLNTSSLDKSSSSSNSSSKNSTNSNNKPKPTRQVSTYSDFKNQTNSRGSSSSSSSSRGSGKSGKGCGHDAAWHKKNGTCTTPQ